MLGASPIWGLAEGSKVTEVIVRHNGTATRYKAVEEAIGLKALREEKTSLEALLATPEPVNEELIELGKATHFYYMDKTSIQARLDEINSILG